MADWRVEIARKVAGVYAQMPAVKAIALIGGLARGRGDRYSDIDLACFWERPPLDDERQSALNQLEAALGTPTVVGELTTYQAFAGEHGLLWEEVVFISGNRQNGFKIDVNHRTVAAMEQIIEDVQVRLDNNGHKQEVLYSMPRVIA